MRNWGIASALLATVTGTPALADISTNACSPTIVVRDFGPVAAPIYYSPMASAGTYRICSTKATIQIILANSDGTLKTVNLLAPGCIDVSSFSIAIAASPATTGNSVFYCKAS